MGRKPTAYRQRPPADNSKQLTMIGDDLIAAARVVKAGIGATLGAFNFAGMFTNYILLSVAVGVALTVSITSFSAFYGVLSFSTSFLGDITSSPWYSFISYTLNFDFLQLIFTSYYLTFVILVVSLIGVASFWLSVIILPHVIAAIRSTINWMTGDH